MEIETEMHPLDWLWEESVFPFIRFAASVARYSLSEEELATYEMELSLSDVEKGKWVHISLPGEQPLTIQIARDPGTSVCHARTNASLQIRSQLEAVVSFLAMFNAVKRGA